MHADSKRVAPLEAHRVGGHAFGREGRGQSQRRHVRLVVLDERELPPRGSVRVLDQHGVSDAGRGVLQVVERQLEHRPFLKPRAGAVDDARQCGRAGVRLAGRVDQAFRRRRCREDDVAGVAHRLDERAIRLAAAHAARSDREVAARVALEKEHVVHDHARAGARQKVDDARMHHPRPGPPAERPFERLQRRVVDLDYRDAGFLIGQRRGRREPGVVRLILKRAGERRGREKRGDSGRGQTEPEGKGRAFCGCRHGLQAIADAAERRKHLFRERARRSEPCDGARLA